MIERSDHPPLLRWRIEALPRIRIAVRARHRDHGFSPVYQSDTHALHIYEYPGVIQLGDQRFEFSPGQYTLTPAGTRSSYDMPAAGHHWCVHFQEDATGRTDQTPLTTSTDASSAADARVEVPCIGWPTFNACETPLTAAEQCARIALLSTAADPSQRHRARLLLQDLLLNLVPTDRDVRRSAPPEASRSAVVRAARRLQERLAEPLDVPELAAHVELSQNYLARRFRAHYGQTMQQYQTRHRIARADLLLRTTDQPVKAIASQVGYPDPQHFNKTFRRITGESPSQRRRRR
ncbi:MAG: helix-turn-helix domain-containing protein [Phycisphaeraceae bacterium]